MNNRKIDRLVGRHRSNELVMMDRAKHTETAFPGQVLLVPAGTAIFRGYAANRFLRVTVKKIKRGDRY